MNIWQERLTTALFCLLLFGFTAATLLAPSNDFSETENRVLAQKPPIKIEAVLSGEFAAAYEAYLNDQFILRNEWVGIKTAAERLLGRQESKDIYFAADGYLLEKHSGTFATPQAQDNIAALVQFVQKYQEQLGEGHISVLIAPNAVDILPNKLPPFAASGSGNEYLTRLAQALPENVWLDLRPALQAHDAEQLYYRTDHHWTTLAAFYAYQAWAEAKGYHVPALSDYEIVAVTDCFEGTVQANLGIHTVQDSIELFLPKAEVAYTVSQKGYEATCLYDYTALTGKDKYAVFFGGNQGFISIKTAAENERRLLVIKDSYANCFIPFMLAEFAQIDMLDLRYDRQRLSERMAAGSYTDLLVLYNAAGFAGDAGIARLLH